MLNAYRKNDAVLIVCQNYQHQTIEIAGTNDKAREVTGYNDDDIIGKPLLDFVVGELPELIAEYIDFENSNYDLGDVLAKIRNIKIRTKSGSIVEFNLRVVRCEAVGSNPIFHLVLQDEDIDRENSLFKQVLHENFKGHEILDEHTGLPDRQSMIKNLELVQHYQQKKCFGACFAALEVDNIVNLRRQYGDNTAYEIMSHIGKLCAQRLRSEDEVGIMSADVLGLILMNITGESARIVLNRLRWSISSMPMIVSDGRRIDLTVSISYHMLHDDNIEEMVAACEQALLENRDKGGNLIHEVK